MLNCKMSRKLSGAGGGSSQVSTATSEVRDLNLGRCDFPINRAISSAQEIFDSTNSCLFTLEPISDIDILPASALQSYTCIYR